MNDLLILIAAPFLLYASARFTMLIAPLIMLLVAGVFSLILLPGLAFVGICMGFGWIFGKLVLDPIEYLFTLIFRRRHASA